MSGLININELYIDFTEDNWQELFPEYFTVTNNSYPFYVSDTFQYEGRNTLRSGSITHRENSTTTITFTLLVDGYIEFPYIVSSESDYDLFKITLDGTEIVIVSGTKAWDIFSQNLTAGTHTIQLTYTKDGSGDRGSDSGAIGYIRLAGVIPPYDRKYLLKSNEMLYTVIDGIVSQLEATEITKQVMLDYGLDEMPDYSILSQFEENVEVIYWHDSTYEPPTLQATVDMQPYYQNVITNAIDLTDPTITGIESMTVNCEGNPLFAVSFDNKATWYAWNGTSWSIVSEEFSGMTKELLESVTYDKWLSLYTGSSSLYIRVSFTELDTKLTEIYVEFAN